MDMHDVDGPHDVRTYVVGVTRRSHDRNVVANLVASLDGYPRWGSFGVTPVAVTPAVGSYGASTVVSAR